MSVIAVKKYDDKIVIGSDSITVRGYTQEKSQNKFAKLANVNGFYIGAAGIAEETALFQTFCATRRPEKADESSLLNFMSEFASWKQGKTGKYALENYYIIVVGEKAFRMEEFFISEITSYAAIGAGSDYALTALHLGHTIDKAIDVACELSIYCEKPVNLFEIKVPK